MCNCQLPIPRIYECTARAANTCVHATGKTRQAALANAIAQLRQHLPDLSGRVAATIVANTLH